MPTHLQPADSIANVFNMSSDLSMFDLRQLQALAAVAHAESFERAARGLHLTQSAVSQRVRLLETQAGQPLLMRSKPVRPTAAGAALLRYYRQMEGLQDAARRELSTESGGPSRLSVAVNADSLATWLPQALDGLIHDEQLWLDLHVDDQDETHNILRTGAVIGCISALDQRVQSCDRVALGAMRYAAVAAPAFVRQYFPNGLDTASLRHAPVIEFNNKDSMQAEFLRCRFGIARGEYHYHQIPSSEGFQDMILRGHGWGMLPMAQAQPYIDTGRLTLIAADADLLIQLYWHVWNIATPLIRRLTDALRDTAAQRLEAID